MGRARAGLILAAVLLLAGCTDTGSPVASPGTPSTSDTTTAGPRASGYPMAKGRRVEVGKGQTGTVTVALGDVLAVYRPRAGTSPGGNALVLAEVTDSQLIYQAIATGKATLSTDDPPPAPICKTTPCPPGRAAPPILTVDVTA